MPFVIMVNVPSVIMVNVPSQLAHPIEILQFTLHFQDARPTSYVQKCLDVHQLKNGCVKLKTELCPICIDCNISVQTSCGHVFCDSCVQKWFNTSHDTCPYCRQTITHLKEVEIIHST